MEEKIKAIVSRYIKTPAEQINPSTIIDRSAVTGSILLHRMYAALSNEGFVVENYWDIKNYGTLLQRLNGAPTSKPILITGQEINIDYRYNETDAALKGIGIDIERIDAMPQVNDFREDEFYTMNFTSAEIAYCILQPNTLASFAGLFAAKEAIVKANNAYKNKPFNTIFIDHLPSGKPVHNEFQLSISHTNELAVAMASCIDNSPATSQTSHLPDTKPTSTNKTSFTFWLALLAFLLSLACIALILARQ